MLFSIWIYFILKIDTIHVTWKSRRLKNWTYVIVIFLCLTYGVWCNLNRLSHSITIRTLMQLRVTSGWEKAMSKSLKFARSLASSDRQASIRYWEAGRIERTGGRGCQSGERVPALCQALDEWNNNLYWVGLEKIRTDLRSVAFLWAIIDASLLADKILAFIQKC